MPVYTHTHTLICQGVWVDDLIARIQCFPAKFCPAARRTALLVSAGGGLNVVADQCFSSSFSKIRNHLLTLQIPLMRITWPHQQITLIRIPCATCQSSEMYDPQGYWHQTETV